ncbi:hypothetical protein [Nocardia farcinica]|uniref:Uncharacterized protein n=1 Tax=Nocardia farcinica (strain IFM 10152) TaxID=247156 RepID=Q5YZS1_NOCFA|nr:hypothetical protein [Nocardia farcinica]BAD56320.1 hypothetical protein NFA_14750 [Nocardia farcinica IFM 10152]
MGKKKAEPRYADGTPAEPEELDVIAQAFGFLSARHLCEVSAGAAPTALGRTVRPRGKAATR